MNIYLTKVIKILVILSLVLILSTIILLGFLGIWFNKEDSADSQFRQIGTYYFPPEIIKFFVSEKYLYTGTFSDFIILDISNPSSPKELGVYEFKKDTEGKTDTDIKNIYVSGDYAYIANSKNGLKILDVSNPSFPRETGVYLPPCDCSIDKIILKGNYIYALASEGNASILKIIDVSMPALPKEIGSFSLESLGYNLALEENKYAYASGKDKLKIIDISNPANPVKVNEYNVCDNTIYPCQIACDNNVYPSCQIDSINLMGKYAYIFLETRKKSSWEVWSLKIIDISNPLSLKAINEIKLLRDLLPNDMKISENYAYLIYLKGAKIFDVSNPLSPKEVKFLTYPNKDENLSLLEKYIYQIELGKLEILDLSEFIKK